MQLRDGRDPLRRLGYDAYYLGDSGRWDTGPSPRGAAYTTGHYRRLHADQVVDLTGEATGG